MKSQQEPHLSIIDKGVAWLRLRPALLREIVHFLLPQRSVLASAGTTFVLGHAEALAVLERDGDFQLSEPVRARFPTGNFILTMEDSEQYRDERRQLCHAFYGENDFSAELTQYVQKRCDEILRGVEPAHGQLDVVGEFAEPVAAESVCRFIIGPAETGTQPVPEWFIPVVRQLSTLVITQQSVDEALLHSCADARKQLCEWIETRVATLGAGADLQGRDAVSNLVRLGMPKEAIVRSIAGMVIAGIGNIAAGVGKAVDELLLRPAILRQAQHVLSDTRVKDATRLDLALRYAFEALRFNPVFPVLTRHCVRQTSITTRTGENVRVAAGDSVIVAVLAAMQDSAAFPDPRRFLIDRPLEKYLHFGSGLHKCFGEQIARQQIALLMRALLSQPGLARSTHAGHSDDLEYEGPYLRHLWVETR